MDHILIAYDEPALCEVIVGMLDETGLQPVCVHSDRDAYAALRDQGPFVGMITDVNLGPGTTGFDVARAARQMNPAIAVIYASGEASPESFRMFGVPDSAFLSKPFRAGQLLQALEAQLARHFRSSEQP